jgi:hypothetical protein
VPGDLPSVVASVNGEEIGRADFENALKALEASAGGPVPVNQRDQIYRRVLDELIAYRLLLQESRTRKIQVNDTEVDERFQSLTSRAGSEEALKGMLARQNLTLEQARAEMKNQQIVSRLLDTQLASPLR